jgi:secondary thiamine-phosphate synthase enzyme
MASFSDAIVIETEGFGDMQDITPQVHEIIRRSRIRNGIVCIANPGSTGGVTTIEYEAGALQDLKEALERLAPTGERYHHDARWGDGNGYAHIRSALVGASRSFPVHEGRMTLGTWQQIVFLDFDNRPRHRRIIVQIVGDA